MPIRHQQQEQIEQWMTTKQALGHCPSCRRAQWESGNIVALSAFEDGGAIPMLQVVCGHCAYVALFSAAVIGLVP